MSWGKYFSAILFIAIFAQFPVALANSPIKEAKFDSLPALRVCCAFGYDLELPVIPVVTISNTITLDDLFYGDHAYGGSPLEDNGLVYTCRGGFIDTAHVRDIADFTTYLAIWLKKHFYSESSLELPDQGTHRIRLFLHQRGRRPSIKNDYTSSAKDRF